MKNGIQQKSSPASMAYQVPYDMGHDDISLVDLAKIIVKRKFSFLLIAIVVFFISLVLAFFMPEKYAYVSLYSVAKQAPTENNPSDNLEPPEAVAGKLRNAFVPQAIREALDSDERFNFDVEVSDLDGAGMVMLKSEEKEKWETLVLDIHQGALSKALMAQQQRVERRRQALQKQIEKTRRNIEEMQAAADVGSEFVYQQISFVAELESKLSLLEDGEVSQVGQKSLEPTSLGSVIIITLGIIVGTIVGVLGTFCIEFVAAVRRSMRVQRKGT